MHDDLKKEPYHPQTASQATSVNDGRSRTGRSRANRGSRIHARQRRCPVSCHKCARQQQVCRVHPHVLERSAYHGHPHASHQTNS